jgi:hypothetical protein
VRSNPGRGDSETERRWRLRRNPSSRPTGSARPRARCPGSRLKGNLRSQTRASIEQLAETAAWDKLIQIYNGIAAGLSGATLRASTGCGWHDEEQPEVDDAAQATIACSAWTQATPRRWRDDAVRRTEHWDDPIRGQARKSTEDGGERGVLRQMAQCSIKARQTDDAIAAYARCWRSIQPARSRSQR